MIAHQDEAVTVHHGDALEVLRELADCSVDSVVCDPPYSLSFMGKSWDEHAGQEDAALGYWLAGFIDGEGCFTVKGHSRGTYAPSFALKVRRDDRAALLLAQRFVGAGQVEDVSDTSGNSHPQTRWAVQDREGCQRLADVLDKYPLRAKKRLDYLSWREAVCEWTDRPRGNRWAGAADQTRMIALRERTAAVKGYVDPPWSGNEFQDWCRLWATECLRVLKPGGYLLAFGGTRTWHRLTCGIEDAGFEIRDSIHWIYGSGFPKSLDVSKAIDKRGGNAHLADEIGAAIKNARESRGWTTGQADRHFCGGSTNWTWYEGRKGVRRPPTPADFTKIVSEWPELSEYAEMVAEAERVTIGTRVTGAAMTRQPGNGGTDFGSGQNVVDITAPATDDARTWQGWGTALKPAHEPIIVARKPLGGARTNVLENVEWALREEYGFEEIEWTSEPVSDAVKLDPSQSSSSTLPHSTVETSADPAAASVTPRSGKPTAKSTESTPEPGTPPTPSTPELRPASTPRSSATPSLTPTGLTASAAESLNGPSSPSTTSAAAERPIEGQSTERSTPNSDVKDSHRGTASFAGIATGLIGSLSHVHIKRLADGRFVWPEGLPKVHVSGATVAANVLRWGTGALNVDGCRVTATPEDVAIQRARTGGEMGVSDGRTIYGAGNRAPAGNDAGRWPPNVVLSHAPDCILPGDEPCDDAPNCAHDGDCQRGPNCRTYCPVAELDRQSGTLTSGKAAPGGHKRSQPLGEGIYGGGRGLWTEAGDAGTLYGDSGGASRFFKIFRYEPKAPKSERPRVDGVSHPTTKPLDLMRWLIRLVTPPGGVVLDPFAGSGTTGEAATLENKRAILIEREADYLPLIVARLSKPMALEFDFGDGAA